MKDSASIPSTKHTPLQLQVMRRKMGEVRKLIGLELWVERANDELREAGAKDNQLLTVKRIQQFLDGETDELPMPTLRVLAVATNKQTSAFRTPNNEEFLDAMVSRLWQEGKGLKDIERYRNGRESTISVETVDGKYEDAQVQGINEAVLPAMMLRSIVDEAHHGAIPFEQDVSKVGVLDMIQTLSSRLAYLKKTDDTPRDADEQKVAYSTDTSKSVEGEIYFKAGKKLLDGLCDFAQKELGLSEERIESTKKKAARIADDVSVVSALAGDGAVQPDHADGIIERLSRKQEAERSR